MTNREINDALWCLYFVIGICWTLGGGLIADSGGALIGIGSWAAILLFLASAELLVDKFIKALK